MTLRTAIRPPVLLSERLRLRPRTAADLDANLAMDLDPEVHRYVYIHGAPDPGVHRRELAGQIEQGWPAPEGALWVVEERADPGFLGWCAVFPLQQTRQIELGYRYARQAWGRGIATEAGRAVLHYAFGELGIDPIVGVTHPNNRHSRHVLEKLGFHYEGLGWYYDTHLTFYRLERERFLSSARD